MQYTAQQLPAYVEATPLDAAGPSHRRYTGEQHRCYHLPLTAPAHEARASSEADGSGEGEGEGAASSDDDSDDEGGGDGGVYTAGRFEAVLRRTDVGAGASVERHESARQWCAKLLAAVLLAVATAGDAAGDAGEKKRQPSTAAEEQTHAEKVSEGLAAKQRGTVLFQAANWVDAAAQYRVAATVLLAVQAQLEQAADGEGVDVRREVSSSRGLPLRACDGQHGVS